MPGEVVLVVDDNDANLQLTKVLLRRAGYSVHTATDAEDTLRRLATLTPKVILMDIQMPRIDGLELTRRLKANPATKDIVIIALTACAMKDNEEKARTAGCDGYVAKPFDTDALPEIVARYLALRAG
jgi:two-component system, cell cycle response regulator DivK